MNLGTCCVCGGTCRVRNILNLPFKSPTPGRGWTCLVCKPEGHGAVSVVCDRCLGGLRNGKLPKYCCAGEDSKQRVLTASLEGEHRHDMAKHVAYESRFAAWRPNAGQ